MLREDALLLWPEICNCEHENIGMEESPRAEMEKLILGSGSGCFNRTFWGIRATQRYFSSMIHSISFLTATLVPKIKPLHRSMCIHINGNTYRVRKRNTNK